MERRQRVVPLGACARCQSKKQAVRFPTEHSRDSGVIPASVMDRGRHAHAVRGSTALARTKTMCKKENPVNSP